MAKRIQGVDDETGLAAGEVNFPLDLPPGANCDEAGRARFAALESDLRRRVRALLLKLRAGDFGDDLTQETLLRVFQHGGHFANEGALLGFVLRVAQNVWKTWIGRLKLVPMESGGGQVGGDLGGEEGTSRRTNTLRVEAVALDRLLDEEQRRALSEAINALPPQGRRVVAMRVYQERSVEEIAALMRLSPGTVKAHLHQSKVKLVARFGAAAQELEL